MPSAREQTIILGAGLAGLAAAQGLRRDYVVLERRATPGGLCDTVAERGYRFDRTGHLLHLSDQRVRRLARDLLGDRLIDVERRARIFSHGVYTHYPFQANTHGLPPAVVSECLTGFIEAERARAGRRVRSGTFERFILDHFGAGIARHFMIPYNTKLWGVHPRQITEEWCDRFVPTPSLAEVVDGAVGVPQDRMGYNASFLYPRAGIGELADALARRVAPVRYGAAPSAIDFRRRRVRVRGEWLPYHALVSSVPLDQLIRLLVRPPARVTAAAARLACQSLRYLDVALERRPGTDYHWSYVPERRYPFYRVGSYSNFSPGVVPRGKGSLYVELAARGPVNLERLMPRVTRGLVDMGIIGRAGDIAFVRARRIRHAYVLYDEHRTAAVRTLLPWLERQRIFSIGRYGRWEYAAMEDAIKQGLAAAEAVENV